VPAAALHSVLWTIRSRRLNGLSNLQSPATMALCLTIKRRLFREGYSVAKITGGSAVKAVACAYPRSTGKGSGLGAPAAGALQMRRSSAGSRGCGPPRGQ
jgi:hypothetical protein